MTILKLFSASAWTFIVGPNFVLSHDLNRLIKRIGH